jgi:nitrogen fixation protein
VAKVKFAEDLTVTEFAEQSEEKLVLTVPVTAVTGKLTITMSNGETVEFDELNVDSPVFCFIPEMPGDDVELKAGELMQVTVVNGEVLTGVQVDGNDVQYILVGDVLYIGLPEKAGFSSKLKLISSNGEVEYDLAVIPNTEITTVLWTGMAVVDDWANQPYVLSDAGQELIDAGVEVGDVISFHITPTADDWKLQIVEGHWGPTYANICNVGNSDTEGGKFIEYDLEANKGYYKLEVTEEILSAALEQKWWGGVFLFNGDNVIVDKITTTHFVSLETTLWEGAAAVDDWGNQPTFLSDAGAELIEVGAKVGQTVYFYITPTEADWKLQIVEGHWGPTYACICNVGNSDTEGGKYTEYDLAGNGGKFGLVLTEEILNAALEQKWWGGVFLANGDNVVITKITIE